MFKALVIPVEGPVTEIELGRPGGDLAVLQEAVGGYIQALPVPEFADRTGRSTVYMNEDGKYTCVDNDGRPLVNWRATDFMVPGVGLMPNDFIAGPFVVAGFDPSKGEHAEMPQAVIDRVRLIEREAGQ